MFPSPANARGGRPQPGSGQARRHDAGPGKCHRDHLQLPHPRPAQICQEADVVVVAMGRMGAVGADCLRPGQTVVDVGIHLNDEASCAVTCALPRRSLSWMPSPRAGRCGHRDHLRAGGPCVEAAEKTLL